MALLPPSTVVLLAHRAARRQWRQSVIIFFLVAIAAMLTNLGMLSATDYPKLVDRESVRLSAPHLVVFTRDHASARDVSAALRADDRVTQVESRRALTAQLSYPVKGEPYDARVYFLDMSEHPTLNRLSVVEESPQPLTDGIYLPYTQKFSGDLSVGDELTLTSLTGRKTYRIQGFFQNLFHGSSTLGAVGFGVSHDEFDRLAKEASTGRGLAQLDSPVVSAVLKDPAQVDAVYESATSVNAAQALARGQSPAELWPSTWELFRAGTLAGPNIYAGSLVAFAVVIAAVVSMVLMFVIRNAVTQDMKAIGTLAAMGTTAAQMIWGLTLPMVAVAGLASLVGIGLSYVLLPQLSASLTVQTGLTWEPGFTWTSFFVVVLGATALVAVTALLAGRRIRNVTPVVAVRDGTATHSFRHNRLRLDTRGGNLNLLMGLKQLGQNGAQNVTVGIVVALVAFAGMFSAALYTNVLGDSDAFARLLIGESDDIGVTLAADANRAETLAMVQQLEGVRSAQWRDSLQANGESRKIMVTIAPDFSTGRASTVYEGREPQHPNEIAIGGLMAEQLDKKVGDSYRIRVGTQERDYVITGLLSTVQMVGMTANLTTEGYQRLDPHFQHSWLSVLADPGVSVEDLRSEVRDSVAGSAIEVTNVQRSVESQMDAYTDMCRILAIGILLVTGAVMCLVLALVTTTMLVRSRGSLAVRKALGFSSLQLAAQTVTMYLPVVAVGATLGVLGGLVLVRPILVNMLTALGIMNLPLDFDAWGVLALILGIVALAAVFVLVACRAIPKLGVSDLATEG